MTCGRKIGPFDCCSVVQGDCLELMKQLPDECVDAVITDPPYGIDFVQRTTGMQIIGDDKPFDPEHLLSLGVPALIFGAENFAHLLPRGQWLVWIKRAVEIAAPKSYGDCELAWYSVNAPVKAIRHISDGCIREGEEHGIVRLHPSQKPIRVMQWCIEQAGSPATILDPYCGSGSTLVAAKKLGRHFLGFEISGEYCAIARERLAHIDAQPRLFEPKPEQLALTC